MTTTAKVIPFPKAPQQGASQQAPAERRSTRKRPKRREEQILVSVTRVPRKAHHDLRETAGCLTLDYTGDRAHRAHTATYDPLDEGTPNAVFPVVEIVRDDKKIEIVSDEGRWVFEVDSDEEE